VPLWPEERSFTGGEFLFLRLGMGTFYLNYLESDYGSPEFAR